MGKTVLHQVLAVDKDKTQQSERIINEAIKTFKDRTSHFDGRIKTYKPFKDDGETLPPESQEIVTTVDEKLDYAWGAITDGINLTLQKEETNASGLAKARLEVDGTDFGEFSATSLLALETKLKKIREMYLAIPTLDPSHRWDPDHTADREGVFLTPAETAIRSTQVPTPITLSEGDEHHPPQVQIHNINVQQGAFTTVLRSARLSPAQKAKYLKKVDMLITGVKMARAKANQAEVVDVGNIGQDILSFIKG